MVVPVVESVSSLAPVPSEGPGLLVGRGVEGLRVGVEVSGDGGRSEDEGGTTGLGLLGLWVVAGVVVLGGFVVGTVVDVGSVVVVGAAVVGQIIST